MSSIDQFTLKPVDKGCPAVATLFEPVRSTIMVRVYAKRIVAACAEWGADRLFIVNKFGVGIFTDSRNAWISGEPIGFDFRRENEAERLRVADLARVARDKRRRAVKLAHRHWKMRLVARGQYQAAERDADRQRAARHAAALTGRALAMKARGERDKLAAYRDRAADQYDRVAAERDAAKRMLADARDKLAGAERERDAQAHAIAALASRVERVEAAAVERRAA